MKREDAGSYSHVLKYTGIFGGVQGLNILVGLVRNKLVALLLGPDGMGLVSLFNSAVTFISQATNFGISFSAVKHISELFDSGDESKIEHFVQVVRLWSFLTALLGMLVCAVAGPWLSESTFSWGDHTLHFVLLSPAVGLLAITGGETAILKGVRSLRSLAVIQLCGVLATLVVSVPLYYYFGQAAIVPVIVLMALVTTLLTISRSYRLYPLRMGSTDGLREGASMIRLGLAFVVAGVLGSGAEMLIRSYMNVKGGLDDVGLYNAGFMLVCTFAGLVFSSMESDFFPRLSAVPHDDVEVQNLTVNRQIEVSVLIVAPLLSLLMVSIPILVPLLFSSRFVAVIPMAQAAVFSMYVKALSLPVSYLTLARGDSVTYMILEGVYDLLLVGLIMWGYSRWGLVGTGVALSVSYVLDLLMVAGYAYFRYGYYMSGQVLRYSVIQLLLGGAILFAVSRLQVFFPSGICWGLGVVLCVVSLLYSLRVLQRKTSLWTALTTKIKKRFPHA
jgi:O-antigen/teichoic acid export membrane protein